MTSKNAILNAFVIILFLSISLFSCRKDNITDTNPSLLLSFSEDTVLFDTVFTTLGSVTRRLKVYNPNANRVVISTIRLGSGGSSAFRLNIDGLSANGVDNVALNGKDSLFIFVRITVDPTNQNSPLVISDSLMFTTNGNLQKVKLVAWGQDAIFHRDEDLQGTQTWDSLKPHVIYGHLRVDTLADLTILAGTKVYLHKAAYLAVSSLASLKIDGNLEHPVRFQGDRLDPFYRDLPGQWDGIYLEKGSKQHEITYAIIKNGINGIAIDSADGSFTPMLTLKNTIIRNMINHGLYAYATSIVSENCVIGDCGNTAVSLVFGGNYDFRQLTIGNFWSGAVRTSPSVYLSNYTYFAGKAFNPLTKAFFGNAIIDGSQDEELQVDVDPAATGEYTFDHCLLKTRLSGTAHFIGCLLNQDPLFVNTQAFDYRIDSLSPANDKGIPMGVLFDILGVDRGSVPDLGAYEFVPGR